MEFHSGPGVDGEPSACKAYRMGFDSPQGLSKRKDTMDEVDEYIAYLVDEGGLIFEGMDENGEALYRHDVSILEQIAPEYLQEHLADIEDTLIELYKKGLVEIIIDDDGTVKYQIAGVEEDLKLRFQ